MAWSLESDERKTLRLARIANRREEKATRKPAREASLASYRAAYSEDLGTKHSPLICPHCLTRGAVTSKRVTVKRGLSGGKATGALLTGGLSILATGLSRKQSITRMTCGHCGTGWTVE